MADRHHPRRRLLGLASALAGILLLTACGGSGGSPGLDVQTPGNDGFHGTHLSEPYVLPSTPLTDTSGKQSSLTASGAPVKVVFFGYSNCPDICQVVMSTVASALIRLPEAQRAKVEVTFVTTDPARDTPRVLREYLDRFNSRFAGLTGPLDRIVEAAEPLHVYLEKGTKLPSGGYEVDHSTYAYGAAGNDAEVIWDQNTSPKEMAADLVRLLEKESA